jgi:diaminopimelate decarboxylase
MQLEIKHGMEGIRKELHEMGKVITECGREIVALVQEGLAVKRAVQEKDNNQSRESSEQC